jgi:methionyl-tRNA formyltransferase
VAIMRVEEGLDTGPWALAAEVPVGDLYLEELTNLLAEVGANALLEALRHVEAGTVAWRRQDDSQATYANKIAADDVALDPGQSAVVLARRVRASSDSAPSVAVIGDVRVRVTRARPANEGPEGGLGAGGVLADKRSLVLGTAQGGLLLETIVPEGRKPMEGAAWARGARLPADVRWSAP